MSMKSCSNSIIATKLVRFGDLSFIVPTKVKYFALYLNEKGT